MFKIRYFEYRTCLTGGHWRLKIEVSLINRFFFSGAPWKELFVR